MKRILLLVAITTALSFTFIENNYAQDQWTQGKTGIYSVGIGGTQLIYLNKGAYNYGYSRTSNIGLSLNVSGEYKVWNWIGVGFQTGLDFMWYNYTYSYYGFSQHYSGGSVAIGIPIGAKANAHILDAVHAGIANKLDVYAGLDIGGGPLFPTTAHTKVIGFMYVGPHAGVRYWFSKIAVFGEFGWGATFANAGITF